MQVIPRRKLNRMLREAGLDPSTRAFPEAEEVFHLTIREREPMPFTRGPHRKVVYPDGSVEGPFPVADRPALSRFLASAFAELGLTSVLATIAEGTFWLNNKAQAAYLGQVPDAQEVTRFLRRRGLTDRFQGGFRIPQDDFERTVPRLAANTFAGGGDVLFTALPPSLFALTALACHHFDLHFASLDADCLVTLSELAEKQGLIAETLCLPDSSVWSELWPQETVADEK